MFHRSDPFKRLNLLKRDNSKNKKNIKEIREELQSELNITHCETNVLACLCRLMENKRIALFLNTTDMNVRKHISNIILKHDLTEKSRSGLLDLVKSHKCDALLEQIFLDIKRNCKRKIYKHIKKPAKQRYLNTYLFIGLFMVLVCAGIYKCVQIYSVKKTASPATQTSILKRSKILNDAKYKICCQSTPTKWLVIKGIFGSGKLTLAKELARELNGSFLFIINAKDENTLYESFFQLGERLAEHQEDENKLMEIERIQDVHKKVEKLRSFIEKKVKGKKNWTLILVGAPNFSIVMPFMPKTYWGVGNIIITTENGLFETDNLFDDQQMVQMPVLSLDEIRQLFLICSDKKNYTDFKEESFKKLLHQIPPYPYDVKKAASLMKALKISLNNYLSRIQTVEDHKQKYNCLRSRTDICCDVFQELISFNKLFLDILICLCCFDQKEIPRQALYLYFSPHLVDQFLIVLKEKSFVSFDDENIYIEPSVHKALILFCQNKYPDKVKIIIQQFLRQLFDLFQSKFEVFQASSSRIFFQHLRVLSKKTSFLNSNSQALLQFLIGQYHFFNEDFLQSKLYLERSLISLKKCKSSIILVKTLTYLGSANAHLLDSKSATYYFKEAESLIKKYFFSEKYIKDQLYMQILQSQFRIINGNYLEAKVILERVLEKAATVYSPNNPRVIFVKKLLADVYLGLGNYKSADSLYKECYSASDHEVSNNILGLRAMLNYGRSQIKQGKYALSKKVLEELHNKSSDLTLPQTFFIEIQIQLASLYFLIGLNEEAKKILSKYKKESFELKIFHLINLPLMIAQYYLFSGHSSLALQILEKHKQNLKKKVKDETSDLLDCTIELGMMYKFSDKLTSSRNLLEKHLEQCLTKYGIQHIETAKIQIKLADVLILQSEFEIAENLLKNALQVLKENQHDDVYLCLFYLANLYKNLNNLSLANKFYKESMAAAKKCLPKESSHILAIKNSMDSRLVNCT